MRKAFIILVLSAVFLPSISLAAEFKGGEMLLLNEPLIGDQYLAGESIRVGESTNGDLSAVGGKITINSNIAQDLNLGGGEVSVMGNVGDDLRILGGNVRVDANVAGDLMVGAGTFELGPNSVVEGDLLLGSGEVTLEGMVKGNLTGAGGNLFLNATIEGEVNLVNVDKVTVGPQAKLLGNLTYRSEKPIQELEAATKGEVIYKVLEKGFEEKGHQAKSGIMVLLAGFSIYGLLSRLFVGLFLIWALRHLSQNLNDRVYAQPLKSLGFGLIFAFLTPVVALILAVTMIGIPMALVMGAGWMVLLYLGKVCAGILIGGKIMPVNAKSEFWRVYGSFALGTLIFSLLQMIPFVGAVLNLIVVLMAIGGLALYKQEMIMELRKKKLV